MRFDFSTFPLKNRAFADKPMTFVDQASKTFMTVIMEIAMIETGNRAAREHWQQKQLQNLLSHASQKSPYWKKRIGAKRAGDIALADLPIQNRTDLVEQFETEGSLMRDGSPHRVKIHSTSGSSGKPVRFFVMEGNTHYNARRSIAQYVMEGRDLSLNRTRVRSDTTVKRGAFRAVVDDNWLPSLEGFIRAGINKNITYFHPDLNLACNELARHPLGHFIFQPRLLEWMLQYVGPDFFKDAGAAMMIPTGETLDPEARKGFNAAGIPVRANYSCEEAGVVASECEHQSGYFHVATSNVILEAVDQDIDLNGTKGGRVLITHLHSYATPFIRYDIGDVASFAERCPCGHDGPVVSNIYGRAKSQLRHRDGRVSIFYLRGKEMAAVAKFDDYRIRQTELNTIVVDIGGRESLTPDETDAFIALIKLHAGDEFKVRINPTAEIDWGDSVKRLGFRSEVM